MEPTTKVVPDVDVEPKEGELNDVVVKENSAKGIIVVEVSSKEIDEVDSIIRSVISSIDWETIASINEKEAGKCKGATGNITKGVINAKKMEEEIIQWMMLLLPSSLSLPYLFSISFDFEQFHLILDNNL